MTTHTPSRVDRETVSVAGASRSFIVVRPAVSAEPVPIVLLFHGSNQSAARFRAFSANRFDRYAQRPAALVAYLDGYQGHWNDARISTNFAAHKEHVDDVGFAGAVIDVLVDRFGADSTRVYAGGYSNGGQMVIRLIHEIPERLAGAAIIAATQPVPENFSPARDATQPLPTVLIHGTKDPLVPYDGGMASLWGFRPRGWGLSAPETAAYYAQRNHITAAARLRTVAPRTSKDPCTVEQTAYCQDGRQPVVLYTIHAGGHTIPGTKKAPFVLGRTAMQFDAVAAIGAFFGLD